MKYDELSFEQVLELIDRDVVSVDEAREMLGLPSIELIRRTMDQLGVPSK